MYSQRFTFSTFRYVTALLLNGLNSFFTSKFYTQYPIMTRWKKFAWNFCKYIKNKKLKYNMYISIHSLCSMLCWSTFGSNYSLKSFWVWRYKLGTPIYGQFLPFFFAEPLRLHQVGWGASVHSHFQISPEMFNWVQVWALAGPLKDIHRVVPKPLVSRLSSRMSLYIAAFIFPSTLTSFPVPAAKKKSQQHDAATTTLHCRDVIGQVMSSAWFPPDMTLGIQAKEFNLYFIRPENFVSHGLRVLQVPFGKLQAGCHVPFTEECLLSGQVYRQLLGLPGLVCADMYCQLWDLI